MTQQSMNIMQNKYAGTMKERAKVNFAFAQVARG